jgi:hypothetical protein
VPSSEPLMSAPVTFTDSRKCILVHHNALRAPAGHMMYSTMYQPYHAWERQAPQSPQRCASGVRPIPSRPLYLAAACPA